MDIVSNIVNAWTNCRNNLVSIEKLNGSHIIIDDDVIVDGYVVYSGITNKNSLLLSNTKDCNINVSKKINNIMVERSSNCNVQIKNGTICGVDIIYSKNIEIFILKNIFNLNYGNSVNCSTLLNCIPPNVLITTMNCSIIKFELNNNLYITNTSLFTGLYVMMFIDSSQNIELHYLRKSDGVSSKGIIDPI